MNVPLFGNPGCLFNISYYSNNLTEPRNPRKPLIFLPCIHLAASFHFEHRRKSSKGDMRHVAETSFPHKIHSIVIAKCNIQIADETFMQGANNCLQGFARQPPYAPFVVTHTA